MLAIEVVILITAGTYTVLVGTEAHTVVLAPAAKCCSCSCTEMKRGVICRHIFAFMRYELSERLIGAADQAAVVKSFVSACASVLRGSRWYLTRGGNSYSRLVYAK